MTVVTQGDRDASADHLHNLGSSNDYCAAVRQGAYDGSLIVQAFASHRLATIEECAKVAETLFTPHGYPAVARNAGNSIAEAVRALGNG